MHLELNGTATDTRATTLSDLLHEQGFDAPSVATALNGVFVPAGLRASAVLVEGARVEVLSPMQGG